MRPKADATGFWAVALTSIAVTALAELGDLSMTQLSPGSAPPSEPAARTITKSGPRPWSARVRG
ncbi:MAG TPA: hypothetical protein VGI96_37885 [Streptosporangiaceae bacterium]